MVNTAASTMPACDSEGFLRNLADWNETVAAQLALQEGITLTAAHWEVITTLRSFYEKHKVSPANRALVSLIRKGHGAEKGQSRYLMGLFGGSPAKLSAKIAGLPKPENCL
jgi:tRNA 2-thiouridine synthesizing protein E